MPSAAERKIRSLERKIRDLEKSSSSSSSRSKKKSSSRSKKKQTGLKIVPRTQEAKDRIGRQPVATSGSKAWEGVVKKDDRGPGKFEDGVRVRNNMNIDALREVDEANKAWDNPAPGRNPREIFFDPPWAKLQGVVRTGKSPKKKNKKNKKKKKKTVHKKKKRN